MTLQTVWTLYILLLHMVNFLIESPNFFNFLKQLHSRYGIFAPSEEHSKYITFLKIIQYWNCYKKL